MRRQFMAVAGVVIALAGGMWWNSVQRNPFAGAVVAICALALAVWLGNKLGKIL